MNLNKPVIIAYDAVSPLGTDMNVQWAKALEGQSGIGKLTRFQADDDGDEIGTACDNCPLVRNLDQLDSDGDGVADELDVCPETVIPEGVPTRRLGRNRFALVDEDAHHGRSEALPH